METIMVSLVTIGLIIVSTLTMLTSSFHAAATLSDSWKEMEAKASSIRNTHIVAVSSNYTGDNIVLTIENQGATDLGDFPSWDVIAAYEDGTTEYMVYTGYPPQGSGKWAVEGIYMTGGSDEKFDPWILNPGEGMKMVLNLSYPVSDNETVRVTIAAPNGVTSQCLMTKVMR
jgi:hypothetical protein